jgi:hypothetical protein
MKGSLPPSRGATDEASEDTLRLEYGEICRSHQAIADFRGKLLGFLPLASGAGGVLLINTKAAEQAPSLLVAAGLLGVAVTVGLYLYEWRGMQECLILRMRGANLEHKLRLRPECSRFQGDIPGFVGPQGAGPVVYFAVAAGWLFVAVHGLPAHNPEWEKLLGPVIVLLYLIAVRLSALDVRRRREELRRGMPLVSVALSDHK